MPKLSGWKPKVWLATLAAGAVVVILVVKPKGSRFHHDFPQIEAEAIIVDETRNPVANASAELTTFYWYPSLLGFGPSGKQFVETFKADASGRIALPLRKHPQITNRKVIFRIGSADKFATSLADDSPWFSDISKPRMIFVRTQPKAPPVGRVNWNGGWGHPKKHEFNWKGQPLYYDLKTGSFVDALADITFHIERPSPDAPDKLDQSLRLRVHYTAGKIQRISSNEYWHSFFGPLAPWGEVEEIKLEARNARHWPTFSHAFAFSSSDGKVCGIMDLTCSPVAERENESVGRINISIAARAEFY